MNVGSGEDAGAFTENLLDINPGYLNQVKVNPSPLGFPADWTRFEVKLTGLNKPRSGRFAFRYLITDGNENGWGVGVDKVQYQSIVGK